MTRLQITDALREALTAAIIARGMIRDGKMSTDYAMSLLCDVKQLLRNLEQLEQELSLRVPFWAQQ